jgi:diguanylate cyclase (GGDEF)-like protein
MSTHDVLTDLGNRSALNSTITMLNGMDVSVGVCFVDINGLKMYNDQHGHDAGDRIIKETATAIGAVFKKKYCYRIGGDEFVVVIPQITQEHFQETISKLEMKTKKYSISMGAVWSDTAEDIRELISQADKLMYADKAEYHSVHDRRQEKQQKGE